MVGNPKGVKFHTVILMALNGSWAETCAQVAYFDAAQMVHKKQVSKPHEITDNTIIPSMCSSYMY